MGVLFSRAKITTTQGVSSVQEYTSSGNPLLPPLMGITKISNEGQASKISVPYIETTTVNGVTEVEYKTVVQPIGQEGWIVKIQSTLRIDEDTGINAPASWQTVDTGQVLLVRSNNCDDSGATDSDRKPYEPLPIQSLWYVDKITISSIKGVWNMAKMELTLVRCWLT